MTPAHSLALLGFALILAGSSASIAHSLSAHWPAIKRALFRDY